MPYFVCCRLVVTVDKLASVLWVDLNVIAHHDRIRQEGVSN